MIFHSADKNYIQILCATSLIRIPQEIVISQKNLTQMTTTSELIDTTDTELLNEVERQVPNGLWSQHDSDVGIIKPGTVFLIKNRQYTYLEFHT